MATAKKTETAPKESTTFPESFAERKTRIKIERIPGQKEQDDVIISINGKRYQIQRGIEVEVPYKVAAALSLWNREKAEAEALNFELMN